MKNSYLNGAFVFDYKNNTCTINFNDELQWLCCINNIQTAEEFAVYMCSFTAFSINVKKNLDFLKNVSGIDFSQPIENFTKEEKDIAIDYLGQWDIFLNEFMPLKERITQKYGDDENILWVETIDFPTFIFSDERINRSYGSNRFMIGCSEGAIQCFDPSFPNRELNPNNVNFSEFFDLAMNISRNGIEQIKYGNILKLTDKDFYEVQKYLPVVFETEKDPLREAFFSENRSFVMQGYNDYKSEYARFLIEKAAKHNNIRFELDVFVDSMYGDNFVFDKLNGKWVNFDEHNVYVDNCSIHLFYIHDGKDGIDADYVLKRIVFTATDYIPDATKMAKEIMKTNKDIAYAEVKSKQGAKYFSSITVPSDYTDEHKYKAVHKRG